MRQGKREGICKGFGEGVGKDGWVNLAKKPDHLTANVRIERQALPGYERTSSHAAACVLVSFSGV